MISGSWVRALLVAQVRDLVGAEAQAEVSKRKSDVNADNHAGSSPAQVEDLAVNSVGRVPDS